MKLFKCLISITAGFLVGNAIYKYINNNDNRKTVKCFISTPMTGKDVNEVIHNLFIAKIEAAKLIKKERPDVNIKFIDSYDPYSTDNPVSLLSDAIHELGKCEYVYFTKKWKESRGCNIEHNVAESYNKKILYEV